MASDLGPIIEELQDAEDKLRARIEKLYGPVGTTDFAPEYAELVDVHDKLAALSAGPQKPTPPSPVPAVA